MAVIRKAYACGKHFRHAFTSTTAVSGSSHGHSAIFSLSTLQVARSWRVSIMENIGISAPHATVTARSSVASASTGAPAAREAIEVGVASIAKAGRRGPKCQNAAPFEQTTVNRGPKTQVEVSQVT